MPRETAQVEQLLASLAGGPAAPASPEEVRQNLVGQVGTALVAYRQGQLSPSQAHDVAGQAATVAAQVASDEALGELRHELAVFLQAAAQVLRGQDWPPLPEAYASVVAQIEEAAGLPPDAAEAPQAPAGVENAEDTEEAEALSAAEQAQLEQAARQVAAMSPEEQALLEQVARQVAAMSPEEQAALQRRLIRDSLVAQVSQAIVALRRGQLPPAQGLAVADQADTVAGQIAADPDLGPERHDLAAFIRAAAQVLRGQPWPPVPQGYGSVVAQIDEEAGGES